MTEDPPLFRFLESQLGPMAGGLLIDEPAIGVQVARFENQPVPDAITYVTTGLSRHTLHQLSGSPIRLELLGCIWSRFRADGLDALLHVLAQQMLQRHHVPAQGEVTAQRGAIAPGSHLEAFCFVQPLYHPDTLNGFVDGEDRLLVAWALPLTAREAIYVRESGWAAFEALVHKLAPDLMDLHRQSII